MVVAEAVRQAELVPEVPCRRRRGVRLEELTEDVETLTMAS